MAAGGRLSAGNLWLSVIQAITRKGLEYVINQLKRIPKRKLHIVLGFVSDKDLNSVLPLFPSSATYYFTKASVPRALDEKILMAEAARWNLKGTMLP